MVAVVDDLGVDVGEDQGVGAEDIKGTIRNRDVMSQTIMKVTIRRYQIGHLTTMGEVAAVVANPRQTQNRNKRAQSCTLITDFSFSQCEWHHAC